MEKKSEIMGIQKAPQNAPRKKETKTERPRVDVSERLEDRLKVSGSPAIGLEYIKEFINPRSSRDHPMYTCSLAELRTTSSITSRTPNTRGTSSRRCTQKRSSQNSSSVTIIIIAENSRMKNFTRCF